MRILQICNKSPLPPKEGGPIAMYNLAAALLQNNNQIDVLAIETPKYKIDKDFIQKYFTEHYTFYSHFINTNINIVDAFVAFVLNKPYHIERFIDNKFSKKLIELLEKTKYDLIIFESIYVSPYVAIVKEYTDSICLLRTHNIESQIWKRIADNEKKFFKKLYLKQLASSLKLYEDNIVNEFDAIACISNNEVDYFSNINQDLLCKYVPFSVKTDKEINYELRSRVLFYNIGSMDWLPNIEGLKWFLHEVVPIINKSSSKPSITLAGRNMPAWVFNHKSQIIDVIGEVSCIDNFLFDKTCLIVPLFSGSGIRIKIIEAMSHGKAVISTTLGAEGINYTKNENIIIADTKEEFANAIIKLANDPQLAFRIGQNAQLLIQNYHSFENTLVSFNNILDTLKKL